MIRQASLLLHFTILLLLLFSCGEEKPELYKNVKGGFQVNFAGTPVESTDDQLFPFGRVEWTVFKSEAGDDQNLSYSVSYTDLPKQIIHSDSLRLLTELFSLTQMDYVNKFGENGIKQTFFRTINDYPGREYTWVDQTSKIRYKRQLFLVKNRLYKLEVSYKTEEEHNSSMKRFFDSFQLISTTSNPNPEPKVEKPERLFTIEFPGNPKRVEQQAYGFFGIQTIVTELYEPVGNGTDASHNGAYGVVYSVLPKDTIAKMSSHEREDFILNSFRTSDMIKNGGKIISEKENTVNDHWCLDATATILHGKAFGQFRMLLIDNYLYLIMVFTESGFENNDAAMRFIDSFEPK
jgi:hypothetical protein